MSGAELQHGFALLTAVVFLVVLGAAVLLMRAQLAPMSVRGAQVQDSADLRYLLDAGEAHARWSLEEQGCSGYTAISGDLAGVGSYGSLFSPVSGSPVKLRIDAQNQHGRTAQRDFAPIRSYGVATLADVSITEDTYIREGSANNYESEWSLKLGGASGNERYTLINLSLVDVPANESILRAELHLAMWNPSGEDAVVVAEALTEDWTPGVVNWNFRKTLIPWSTPGGTVTTVGRGSGVLPSGGTAVIDITELVRNWRAGTANHGVRLRYKVPENPAATFYASEDVLPPAAKIYHACECGEDCAVDLSVSCDADFRPNSTRPPVSGGPSTLTGVAAVAAGMNLMGVSFPAASRGVVLADRTSLSAFDANGVSLGTCSPGVSYNIAGVSLVRQGDRAGELVLVHDTSPPTLSFVGASCAITGTSTVAGSSIADPRGVSALGYATPSSFAGQVVVVDENGSLEWIDLNTFTATKTETVGAAVALASGLTQVPNQDVLLVADNATAEVLKVDFSGTVLDRYDFSRSGSNQSGGMSIDLASCDHINANATGGQADFWHYTALSADAIAHWKVDETSGTTAADSVGSHDGTLRNTAGWAPNGVVQGAVQIPAGGWIEVANAAELQMTDEVTVSAWAYFNNLSGYRVLVAKGFGTTLNYALGVLDGVPGLAYHDGSYTTVTAPTTLSTGRWYHLAYSYSTSSGLIRFYLDGVEVHQTSAGGVLTTSNAPVLIGRSDATAGLDGLLDDVRLFNAELSASDIQLLYNEGDVSTGLYTGGCTVQTYRDEFNTIAFDGDDGSASWAANWSEVGESDGAGSGDVLVQQGSGLSYLRVRDNDNGGEGVRRSVDLSSADSAELSFNFASLGMRASESVAVSVIHSGGTSVVFQIDDSATTDVTAMDSQSVSLDAFLGEVVEIQFRTSANMHNNRGAYIDNVEVEVCTP